VVIFGRAEVINDKDEKLNALRALSDHMIPGRWADVRQPNQRELELTTVLSLPIAEASAKIRSGPPLDDDDDYDLPIWAGVIPFRLAAGTLVADPRLHQPIPTPEYAQDFARPVAASG